MPERFPSVEKVAKRTPSDKWGVIDNDGNRACWWCLVTVHPTVAHLHDRWHLTMWERDGATIAARIEEGT